jgi:striatin 1/3/4
LNQDEEEKLNKEVTVDFSKASNEEIAAALKDLRKASRKKKVGTMEYKPIQIETSWKPKNTLKSHLDGVRSVEFLENDGLISASEDGTCKLWNAETGQDVVSFYGHAGMVTSVLADLKENVFFSASADSSIMVWDIPDINMDPFGAFGNALKYRLHAYENVHTDVIWDLKAQHNGKLKFSASSDGSVGIWKYDGDSNAVLSPLSYDINSNGTGVIPTSIAPFQFDNHKIAVSYRNGHVLVYDLERAVPVSKFIPEKEYWATKLLAHPKNSQLFAAGSDGTIQYLDIVSGQVIEKAKAHGSAVTAMTLDHSGDTLISACHEASIRFWNTSSRKCELDIAPHQTHRKKHNESINALAFHPSKNLLASAGADGIIKTFSP